MVNNGVKGELKKGFLWSSVLQLSSVGVQFLSTIILARFLTPNDYGVLGAVTIFIAIGEMFVNSGMGGSLIKKSNVREIDFSTLFIYNFTISILIYLVLFICAPSIADFYKIYNELDLIIQSLSVVIVIHALSLVQQIKLMKALQFKALAVISVVANLLGLLLAIVAAVRGMGVWSLIIQQIASAFFMSVVLFFYNRYIPSWRFSFSSFKEQFSWGMNLLLANSIKTVNDNIYSSIIAKYSSSSQAGFYVQAVRMKNLPVNVMTQVVDRAFFPILSQYADKEELKYVVRKLNRVMLLIIIPILLLIAYLSDALIYILLGAQWLEASWTLEMLMYASVFMCLQSLYRNILKSLGNVRDIFRNELVKISVSLVILFISLFGGYRMILLGIVISSLLGFIWVMFTVRQCMKFTWVEQLKDILPILGVNLLTYICVIVIFMYTEFTLYIDVLLKLLCFIVLLIVFSFLFRIPECRYLQMLLFRNKCGK